jgi:hypothetical protein
MSEAGRSPAADARGLKPGRADALVTVPVLLLVFAAFDDITTDNAASFRVEYAFLVISAAWLLTVALRLLAARELTLGIVSIGALAGAVWGQRAIGPGITAGFRAEYVVAIAAYLWYWALALLLFCRGGARGRETGQPCRIQ